MNNVILANIFLGCFLVGFIFTAASFLFGLEHSHTGGDVGHLGGNSGGGHGGHGGDGGHGGHGDGDTGGRGGMSLLNMNSIAMFFTWFGAVGFILNKESRVGPLITVLTAVIVGFIGAVIILLFVNKFLMKGDTTMRASDYYLPGTLAKVTSGIREGGAGEIVYVQGGTRKTAGARSDEEQAHPLGQEVVIVRYDKGLAYVRAVDKDEFGLDADPGADPVTDAV